MRKDSARKRYQDNPKAAIIRLIVIVVIVVAVFAVLYVVGRNFEQSRYGEVRGDLSERIQTGQTVSYNGETYAYRKNLTTVLFMGVDQEADAAELLGGFRNGGQADFLMLLVIDPDAKTVSRLEIDRDTMAEITTLGILGKVSGTRRAQISLSHGFGDGKAQSAELTVEAVERLLYGAEIDHYVALTLDSIPAINDAVGGVTVPIEDDFSAFDPQMVPGTEVKLTGDQAELYVRSRMAIGDGTNESRMRRQRVFLTELLGILEGMIADNANSIGTLYDAMGPSLVSDMNRGLMINEAYKASKYQKGDALTIPGEHAVSESGFMEFHADEEELAKMVVEVFFTKVSG